MIEEVVIDSSVWIHTLRSKDKSSISARVNDLILEDKAVTLPMIRMEILGGTKSLKEFKRLNSRLSGLRNLDISENIWEIATQWAFELRQNGYTIPNGDILIAASAKFHDLKLMHADKHFDIISENTDLRSENVTSYL